MTNFIIKDGTGTGYTAKVDSNNRVLVRSTGENLIKYISSAEGGTYTFLSTEKAVTVASGENHLLWIKNTNPTQKLHINNIYFNSDGGTTTNSKISTFRIRINSTTPTANNTSTTGTNYNLTSSNLALVEGYYWNGTGNGLTITTPGNMIFSSYFGSGQHTIELQSALVLGYGNVIDFSAQVLENSLVSIIMNGFFE